MISFPCTTKLSFDFFKSRVSISRKCQPRICAHRRQVACTICTDVQIDDRTDSNINDTQESLILLLELFLVEYLDCQDAVFCSPPDLRMSVVLFIRRHAYMSKLSFQYGLRVFLITEVVLVWSPEMVATAKGSGNPMTCKISAGSRSHDRTY